MNRTIKLFAVAALSLLALGCVKETPSFDYADKGPVISGLDCSQSAYMGEVWHYSINVTDASYKLSTMTVQILFDETVVAEDVVRTKEQGNYKGTIQIPLLAKIPDGDATVKFTAQNVGLAKTTFEQTISVKRPDFATITLINDGKEYTMTKESGYKYSVTAAFPQSLKALVKTPAVNAAGDVITIGWSGSALSATSTNDIPIYNGSAGIYTATIDLYELSAGPFGTTSVAFSEANPDVTMQLCQNTKMLISGLEGWNHDVDWFDVDGTTIVFKGMSGNYKLAADYSNKFLRVDPVDDEGNYYGSYNADEGLKAIYCIGAGMGKKGIQYSWNTTAGAWPMVQTEEGIYKITFKAGRDIAEGSNFKFFFQRGWGGEFKKANYASIELGSWFAIPGDDGNLNCNKVSLGKGYEITIDVTAGTDAAKISAAEVELPAEGLQIDINGAAASMIDDVHYCVASVKLGKGDAVNVNGVDISTWWPDPDYLYIDGGLKFGAMEGYYMVDLYLDKGYATFKRLTGENGSKATTTDGHACWLMAWGLANWKYSNDGVADSDDNQLAFNPGSSYCMAEVENNVYQFSGYAVENTDTETLGGRFRYDYMSAKYFGQDSWGNEKGKIMGSENTVEYTARALELLAEKTGGDNLELASGVTLELGAFYVLTFDFSQSGKEIIDFYKK